MYPRWRPEDSGSRPVLPKMGDSGLRLARQDLFPEPLPDLESQLSAELSGACWAVVDFAPEDGEWCDWVYKCLNGYPLPSVLVDRVTPNGLPRPDFLSIFPDRRDPSHSEHAAQALKEAAYLIVICSPQSAGSPRISETIRAFRNAGGEERIIALVVDGPLDSSHDEAPRANGFEWLPPWLRWRCDEKEFCPADRTEFRIVDGRRGYSTFRQMRNDLLTAAVDIDTAELESLGAFHRPLPDVPHADIEALSPMPSLFPADLPAAVREPGAQRDALFMIGTAVVLIMVAVIFGIKSFRELSAEENQSALSAAPMVLSRMERLAQSLPRPSSEPDPEPVAPISPPVAAAALPAVVTPAPVTTGTAPATASSTEDSVLLDEVKTLERRGDEITAERRTEDALDLYRTALASATEYANREGATPSSKYHVVLLQRKIGQLQLQNAATAEARATYQQARKNLLQLKRQGTWGREYDQTLDELESRLLSLPKD